ncbi:MAG: ABC transporter ATP-binding protein [Anaerolineae bacterium]|nr:ABC transporter ATP-binding protein [Anaerolineae bacterium]
MSDFAIRVNGLGKSYQISHQAAGAHRYRTLREDLINLAKNPFTRSPSNKEIVWALQDVSFEVEQGTALGIIGRNGAGKSTLLKLLSRITRPTTGHADIYGRVGSLLEVGTGFHPELTGRENIFLNGAVLGMSRREIQRHFDEIVEFSGVEKFLDTPVKRFSSGMYMRLAFSVAAHLETEILLIDEVLAVGDAAFQKKCLGKMGDVAKTGRTVLFVSHQMASVQTLCEQTILLDAGQVRNIGDSNTIIREYLKTKLPQEARFGVGITRKGTGQAHYTQARILDESGQPSTSIPMGGTLIVELEFETQTTIKAPNFGLRLYNTLKQDLVAWRTEETVGEISDLTHGGKVRLEVTNLNLMPGIYYAALGLSDGYETHDLIEEALELEIVPHSIYPTGRIPSKSPSVIFTPCSWSFDYQ